MCGCVVVRRHTRWPRDWSSDVCSSDLNNKEPPLFKHYGLHLFSKHLSKLRGKLSEQMKAIMLEKGWLFVIVGFLLGRAIILSVVSPFAVEIGRASCRESVYVWMCGRTTAYEMAT